MKPRFSIRRCLRYSPGREVLTRYRHMAVQDSDVFLAAYPKSGLTWLRNMLAAYFLGDVENWLSDIQRVSRYVGRHRSLKSFIPGGGRLIKTHEPYRGEYQKAILLLRDGRDIAVSEYHYRKKYRRDNDYRGVSFSQFLEMFLAGKTNGYGSWDSHVRSWMNSPIKQSSSQLVLTYESLKTDSFGEFGRVLDFLGVASDPKRVRAVVELSSVNRMRSAESKCKGSVSSSGSETCSFIRKGEPGRWRDSFSKEDNEKFLAKSSDLLVELGYELYQFEDSCRASGGELLA